MIRCPLSGHFFINTMIDFKNFGLLLDSVAEEKGLSKERVLETVEQALATAYKKEFGKRECRQ